MAERRRPSSRHPDGQDPIEPYIASQLRRLRHQRGLSLAQLGDAIGVSFQQIQKYECGHDRISGSTLYRLAGALNVPLRVFFEGFDDQAPLPPAVSQDAAKLSGAVSRIPNPDLRAAVISLVVTLIGDDQDGD